MADAISGASTAAAATGRASNDAQKLADDLDDFMTLLTTQLQHQDPLDPMDATEFTSQLVKFASVEQQIQQNANLETLIQAQENSELASIASYVGRMAEVETNQVQIYNGEAEFNYVLHENAAGSQITIQDDNGNTVFSGKGNTSAGKHGVVWDGSDLNGNQLPDGLYRLTVTALDEDGAPVDVTTTAVGKITGVSYAGDEPALMMTNQAISLDSVISLKEEAIELSEVDSIAAANLKAKAAATDAQSSNDSAQSSLEAAEALAADNPITEVEAELEKIKEYAELAEKANTDAQDAYQTAINATSSPVAVEAAQTAITESAKASTAASAASDALERMKALIKAAEAA